VGDVGSDELRALLGNLAAQLGPIQRDDSQAFAGRIAGRSDELAVAGGALGTAGQFVVLAEVGGRGVLQAWEVFVRGRPAPQPAGAVVSFAAVARIRWNVDGAHFEAFFDAIQGTRLTVASDWIQLAAAAEGAVAAGEQPAGTTANMLITGLVSTRSAAQPTPAQRTRFPVFSGAPLTAVVTVPEFSKDVRIESIGGFGGNLLVEGLDSAAAVTFTVLLPAAAGPSTPILLSNDTTSLRLTPQAAAITDARCVFGLSL
jgi:hypothetical protein